MKRPIRRNQSTGGRGPVSASRLRHPGARRPSVSATMTRCRGSGRDGGAPPCPTGAPSGGRPSRRWVEPRAASPVRDSSHAARSCSPSRWSSGSSPSRSSSYRRQDRFWSVDFDMGLLRPERLAPRARPRLHDRPRPPGLRAPRHARLLPVRPVYWLGAGAQFLNVAQVVGARARCGPGVPARAPRARQRVGRHRARRRVPAAPGAAVLHRGAVPSRGRWRSRHCSARTTARSRRRWGWFALVVHPRGLVQGGHRARRRRPRADRRAAARRPPDRAHHGRARAGLVRAVDLRAVPRDQRRPGPVRGAVPGRRRHAVGHRSDAVQRSGAHHRPAVRPRQRRLLWQLLAPFGFVALLSPGARARPAPVRAEPAVGRLVDPHDHVPLRGAAAHGARAGDGRGRSPSCGGAGAARGCAASRARSS